MCMEKRDADRLADELEHEAEELEERSRQLGDRAEEVREQWERKRGDPNVPGAPPPKDRE